MTATREEWLTVALGAVETTFNLDLGERDVVCSVGHPARQGRRVRLVDVAVDVEGGRQVYVSPYVSESPSALALLLWAGIDLAHDSERARTTARRRAGFTTAPTGVILPGEPLQARLTVLAAALDPYPHVYTDPSTTSVRTQTTRMLKASCANGHPAYVVRLSRTQADRGMPACGVCLSNMTLG